MSFERLAHPEWVTVCAVVGIGAAVALLAARLLAQRRLRRLLGAGVRIPEVQLRSDAALWIALAVTLAALLGPRVGERVVRVPAAGVDVVFLLDVSRSMDARDVPPSRIDRARRASAELLARLGSQDRAAIAAFGGRGVLLTPLTPDHAALVELLDGLDTDLVHPPGSRLGRGVEAALDAFEAGSERPRVLFVLSDGEDRSGERDLGAASAVRAEVRVLTAAIGSETGATVPDHGVPLRGADGRAVVSRRRLDPLSRLASATGGELFSADAWGAFDFDAAARAIRRDALGASGGRVERRVRAVQVLPFAAAAFATLLIEGLPRPRPSRARRGRARRWKMSAAALAAALASGAPASRSPAQDADGAASLGRLEARVRADPRDARLLTELGLARLAQGQRGAAGRAFLAAALAARDPSAASLAYFDLGVTALEQGEFEAARDAFFDALALDPTDSQARFNLEWTLAALAAQPPAPAPRRPSGAAETPGPERAAQEPSRAEPARREPEPPAQPTAAPPPLSAEERRRWLDRVSDDPARALRAAARGEVARASRSEPAW
ncbi:MAG: VWA domain-containing protein [Myxococcota bacterium]